MEGGGDQAVRVHTHGTRRVVKLVGAKERLVFVPRKARDNASFKPYRMIPRPDTRIYARLRSSQPAAASFLRAEIRPS